MRPDMAELLTEVRRSPRDSHNQLASQKWGKRLSHDPDSNYEDQINWIAMGRQPQGKKCSNPGTNPLKRYLRKNLGRPWDKVYSEIRQNLGWPVVWKYFVDTNCFIEVKTGKIISQINGRSRMYEVDGFYVHPKTKLLREQVAPKTNRYAWYLPNKEKETPTVKISETEKYIQLDGIWYYQEQYEVSHEYKYWTPNPPIRLGDKTESTRERKIREVEEVLDGKTMHKLVLCTHLRKKTITNKRQLSSKELKKLKLKNQAKPARPLSRRESRRLTKDLM